MAIVLYHDWDSFKSVKVRLCLLEKQIEWTGRVVSLAALDHFDGEFLALNPAGVIPVLVHDGKTVCESTVINEYLDDISPAFPLRPADPFARARMRIWAKFEDEVVHPAVRVPTFNLMTKQRVRSLPAEELDRRLARSANKGRADAYRSAVLGDVDEKAIVDAIRAILRIVERMDETLSRTKWLAGPAYSLADIAMTAFVDRIEVLGMEMVWSGRPHLRDWVERIKARPSYAAALPGPADRMPSPDRTLVRKFLAEAVPETLKPVSA